MSARTMAHFRREPTEHTPWCARDHRCGITEHRSPDLIADEIGGRAIVTRVRAGDVDYIEIRARIPLHHTETGARWQLATTLRLMRELLAEVAIRQQMVRHRTERPAVGRRAAQ
ncbi:hypothetical protein Aab01nite_85980 [Paractinoplanes abujensis]|uniref:Uncharacterized protein n=1 Tax=Paractinoplanes abujensis TaxID=882441 RepID=A0A7W7CVE1_9ACTN|nr:hypothetical protein [Actinoplanes abujensis]MBB4695400.1 hypothetical protein [Actinoplanes abujensis]GID25008.1 hypothetical protein Aab01nite_85980 [Actinoplanes abujensis]